MVKLLFPNHAQYRLQERGISIEHVKQAIRQPDFTEPTFEGRVKARKEVEAGRTIEVVYYRQGFKGANDYVIITAYYLTQE